MEVRLGDTVARCPECQGADFGRPDPGAELDELSELLCTTCERVATHGELLLQIGPRALATVATWTQPAAGS